MEEIQENVFRTDWINAFCSTHKLYGVSISILADEAVKEIAEDCNLTLSKSKSNDNEYLRLKLADGCKIYDDKKQIKEVKDIEDLFRKNEVRMIFQIKEYNYMGKSGHSAKVKQIMTRKKQDKFEKCFF